MSREPTKWATEIRDYATENTNRTNALEKSPYYLEQLEAAARATEMEAKHASFLMITIRPGKATGESQAAAEMILQLP